MAAEKKITLTYTPPGDGAKPWVQDFPAAQAEKMLKLGRWKKKTN